MAYESRFEQRNYELWLQGLYFHDAVSSALAMAFWNKKGRKPDSYMKQPIPITDHEKELDKQRRMQETLNWVAKHQKK